MDLIVACLVNDRVRLLMLWVQAGAFARNAPAATSGDEVEEGEEGSGGIRSERPGEEVEISSENTGPAGSQSGDGSGEEEGHGDGGKRTKRSRKSYHRHTAEQVRVMEA